MAILMQLIEAFGLICLKIFGGFVWLFDRTAGQEFVQATDIGAAERKALYESERRAIDRLTFDDQALMWLADGRLTQAKAAKRRYWKNSDPKAFAKLYKKLGFTEDQLNYEMIVVERMPGYFRKNVRQALAKMR